MPPNPDLFPPIKPPEKRSGLWSFLVLSVVVGLMVVGSIWYVGRVPTEFVAGTIVTIPRGSSTNDAAELLEAAHVVRYASVFEFMVAIVYAGAPIIAGDFQFDEKIDTLGVAERLTGGAFGAAAKKITIPEGSSVADIARIVVAKIPSWNADEFTARAKPSEGFLFPATYSVFKTIEPQAFVNLLRDEYEKRIAPLRPEIKSSGYTEKQIIIMASILEKEAFNADEARVVAGILWKRMKNGQALQVDAPFLYILNKTSAQLTRADLQKDGPYNTYTRKGLPIGPIGNPGIEMITAAINPEPSPYNFYLHGDDGVIRYAKTYAEHLQNKQKYIK